MGCSELAKMFCIAVATFRKWRREYCHYPETETSCYSFLITRSFDLYLFWLICTCLLEIKCTKYLWYGIADWKFWCV